MTKNIAKHAFKSGMLPRVRRAVPRVKAEFELQAEAQIPTGFTDPQMVPRGSVANPPTRVAPSAEYKIKHSAKEPRKDAGPSEHQQYKALSAQVRRVYLKESLEAEQKKEEQGAVKRQLVHDRAAKRRAELDQIQDSQATRLTLPSIDQSLLLDGPMVRRRSEQEQRELELKRRANLATTRLNQARHRDQTLLSLYQNARQYIITEEDLDAAIESAFKATNTRHNHNDAFKVIDSDSAAYKAEHDRTLVSALTGTVPVYKSHTDYDYYPGLDEITDRLEK